MTPNYHYSGCTAPLNSKRCMLYIYSTNKGTEYFEHGIYSPFFFKCSLFHNSLIFGSCIIHNLYTGCAKIKKKNYSGAKRLTTRTALSQPLPRLGEFIHVSRRSDHPTDTSGQPVIIPSQIAAVLSAVLYHIFVMQYFKFQYFEGAFKKHK